MKLSRRRILQLASVLATAAAGGIGVRRWVKGRAWTRIWNRTELVGYLADSYADLRPDPKGIEKFVDLYLEHYVPKPGKAHLSHLEQTFLMSTDFFQNGQPASGPIRFVLLYHPYVSPCYNPFALAG